LTSLDDLQKALQNLDEGMADGARASELARLLGVGLTTLQRWRRRFAVDGDGVDRRKSSHRHVGLPEKMRTRPRHQSAEIELTGGWPFMQG